MDIRKYADSLPQIELYDYVGVGDEVLSIKIIVAGTNLPDFEDRANKEILNVAYKAGRDLENLIKSAQYRRNPKIITDKKRERDELLNLFCCCGERVRLLRSYNK